MPTSEQVATGGFTPPKPWRRKTPPVRARLVQIAVKNARNTASIMPGEAGLGDQRGGLGGTFRLRTVGLGGRVRPLAPSLQESSAEAPAGPVYLRVVVDAGGKCRFAYSADGTNFLPLGEVFTASVDRWIGAKVGLFASAGLAKAGYADFDWFRVTP